MALICLVLALSACQTPMATPTREPDPVTLQLNWVHAPEFAGYYVAEAKGFYAQENLAVTLLPNNPDKSATQVLADGEADFAVSGVAQLKSMVDAGYDPVALAALFQISPRVLFTLADAGIRHPRDLAGHVVGIKSAGWRQSVHDTLAQIGLDPTVIEEVDVNFDDMEMLYDGSVDVWTGFAIDEVVVARRDGYDVNLIFPSDYAVGTYIGLILALREQVEADPELVERFVRASLRGWEYAIQNPDEAATIIGKWDEAHDLAFHRAAIQELVPLIDTGQVPIGWIDQARWERELGAHFDRARSYVNLDGLLSIPANQAWTATEAP